MKINFSQKTCVVDFSESEDDDISDNGSNGDQLDENFDVAQSDWETDEETS